MSTQAMTYKIAEYFKTQPVLKAWLFGSFARGEQRAESDVDILILPDKSQHFSLFTLSEIYEDLKELLGREVDVFCNFAPVISLLTMMLTEVGGAAGLDKKRHTMKA